MVPHRGVQTEPNRPKFAFFLGGGGVQTVPSSRTHLRDEFCIPSPGGGGDKGGGEPALLPTARGCARSRGDGVKQIRL